MIDPGRFFRVGAAFALLAAASATAQDSSPRQVKRSLKEANSKWLAGDVEAAVALYEGVLAATAAGAPERADALYGVIVASLAARSPRPDPDRIRELLSEYERFPAHPRRFEVEALEGLMGSAESAREETARLSEELAAERDACERERSRLRESSGERNESLEAEIEALAGKLAAAEETLASKDAELRAARAELAKKEEALEKLRQRVVGRSGDG